MWWILDPCWRHGWADPLHPFLHWAGWGTSCAWPRSIRAHGFFLKSYGAVITQPVGHPLPPVLWLLPTCLPVWDMVPSVKTKQLSWCEDVVTLFVWEGMAGIPAAGELRELIWICLQWVQELPTSLGSGPSAGKTSNTSSRKQGFTFASHPPLPGPETIPAPRGEMLRLPSDPQSERRDTKVMERPSGTVTHSPHSWDCSALIQCCICPCTEASRTWYKAWSSHCTSLWGRIEQIFPLHGHREPKPCCYCQSSPVVATIGHPAGI